MQSMPLPVSTIGKQRLMMSANCFGVRYIVVVRVAFPDDLCFLYLLLQWTSF
ncbi:hypothetical protein ACVXHA_11215 [Escherichia coli]